MYHTKQITINGLMMIQQALWKVHVGSAKKAETKVLRGWKNKQFNDLNPEDEEKDNIEPENRGVFVTGVDVVLQSDFSVDDFGPVIDFPVD